MANHSSILAWGIPWTMNSGGLQSVGSQSQTWLKWISTKRICLIHGIANYSREHTNILEKNQIPWYVSKSVRSLWNTQPLPVLLTEKRTDPNLRHMLLSARETCPRNLWLPSSVRITVLFCSTYPMPSGDFFFFFMKKTHTVKKQSTWLWFSRRL